MRFTSVIIASAIVIMPAQALACSGAQHCQQHSHNGMQSATLSTSSTSVSREAGVLVYRGSIPKPNYLAASALNAQKRVAEQSINQQARQRRADDRLSRIESMVDDIQVNNRSFGQRRFRRSSRRNNFDRFGLLGGRRFFGRSRFGGRRFSSGRSGGRGRGGSSSGHSGG